jgi:RimJ/RimL family protein N-acetyltransferase
VPIPPPELETHRLRIRAVADFDLQDLMSVNGDPEVTKFLPYATWASIEDAVAWLNRMKALQTSGSGVQLVVQDKGSNLVVGTVLLFKLDDASSRVEIGYVLGRHNWGRGLMKEALSAVIGHCFAVAGLRRIEAEVNPDNIASNKLLLALRFALEGRARKRWVAKGAAYDTNLYGLLASEWPPSAA